MNENDRHIPETTARRDFFGGVSAMWFYRRRKDDPDFPRPIKIHGRNFYRLNALRAYVAAKENQSVA